MDLRRKDFPEVLELSLTRHRLFTLMTDWLSKNAMYHPLNFDRYNHFCFLSILKRKLIFFFFLNWSPGSCDHKANPFDIVCLYFWK